MHPSRIAWVCKLWLRNCKTVFSLRENIIIPAIALGPVETQAGVMFASVAASTRIESILIFDFDYSKLEVQLRVSALWVTSSRN